mmetsp:Transcript_22387/g.40577  ORF Transcript_22387/g.40577 Transcript_22387/m.40577 type:complete len:210 (-) Transcript_22387:41-670(-)
MRKTGTYRNLEPLTLLQQAPRNMLPVRNRKLAADLHFRTLRCTTRRRHRLEVLTAYRHWHTVKARKVERWSARQAMLRTSLHSWTAWKRPLQATLRLRARRCPQPRRPQAPLRQARHQASIPASAARMEVCRNRLPRVLPRSPGFRSSPRKVALLPERRRRRSARMRTTWSQLKTLPTAHHQRARRVAKKIPRFGGQRPTSAARRNCRR